MSDNRQDDRKEPGPPASAGSSGNKVEPALQAAHEGDAFERKRRAARRRLIMGTAAAVPVIVTLKYASRAEAKKKKNGGGDLTKVGRSVCMSIGIIKKDDDKKKASVFCKVL